MSLGHRVLVPVANPATVTPLLQLAARLTDAEDGCVVPVTVIAPGRPEQEFAEAYEAIAQAEHVVARNGRQAAGQVITCHHPAEGVLDAIGHAQASLVVMGWRGRSSTSDIFGRLIDTVVGRSSVPLAIVRLGAEPYRRVLFPVSADHLLPAGVRGLELASGLAARLGTGGSEPTTLLRTGNGQDALPANVAGLSDRVHRDPRRIHHAVGAAARPQDLVVAAVAPTVSGLRTATTHLAWAAPEATLLVAVDVGPTEQSLVTAVGHAGRPAPARPTALDDEVRVVVTACLPATTDGRPDELERMLGRVGLTERVMAWRPTGDPRPHVRATVTVRAPSPNAGLSQVMTLLHEADGLRGAEITYELDRAPRRLRVAPDDLTVTRTPAPPSAGPGT